MTQFSTLLLTLITGLFLIVGSIIVFLSKNNDKLVNFSISMAFGVILMLIMLELLPESYELMNESINGNISYILIFIFVIIGILILKLLDLFIPDHDLENESEKEKNENLFHIGIVSSIALILHNLIEGMAIYSTVITSFEMGLMLVIGVGLHNIPMGMVVTSTFYKANNSKFKTFCMIFIIAISTFIGGLIMFLMSTLITNTVLAILLCITLGMLIYIIIFELLPEMKHSHDIKNNVIGIIIGILIFLISTFLE